MYSSKKIVHIDANKISTLHVSRWYFYMKNKYLYPVSWETMRMLHDQYICPFQVIMWEMHKDWPMSNFGQPWAHIFSCNTKYRCYKY